jgi:hypothetical protein
MNRILIASLTSLALLGAAGSAQADWQRKGTWTGPNGKTTTVEGSGSCANGTCSSSTVWIGPNGKKSTRSSTTVKTGAGTAERNTTYTGPNGRVVKRKATISVQ